MKKTLLALFVISFSLVTYAQTGIIFQGDKYPASVTEAWSWGQSSIAIDTGKGENGTNAIKWVQGDEWAGSGWTGIGWTIDPPFDLSRVWEFESVTFTMKCDTGVGALRVQYEDGKGKKGLVFTPTADNQWHKYTFPLKDLIFQDNTTEFDPSKVTTVGIMAEASGKVGKVIYLNNWYVTTVPSIIMFNGVAVPTTMDPWTWGSSSVEVVPGAGPLPKTNAFKWTQGEVSMGFGFTVDPLVDLSKVWEKDSMKITMKAEEGVDTMAIMFYDSPTKYIVGTVLKPIADNQWHTYKIPLKNFKPFNGETNTFKPEAIWFVEVNSGIYGGKGAAGKSVYFSDWWTGNPVFDVMAPNAPAGFTVTPTDSSTNVITWTDVTGESSERYNIYYSKSPITDVMKTDVVSLRVKDGVMSVEQEIKAPLTDQDVSYYYAITCTDASGNTSEPATFGPVKNKARGVGTVSLAPPKTFAADGDLTEWAAIKPIHISRTTGLVATGTTVTDDADLSVDSYLAIDNTYLYVAFDVEDDKVNATTNDWADDCPDLYIGLYNWHGVPHTGFVRGKEPDYHFRFLKTRVMLDWPISVDSLVMPGVEYSWSEKFPSGYTVEARIPLKTLAEKCSDEQFVPVNGYRVPVDFDIIDSDVEGAREGVLCYSKANDAMSWSSPQYWTYTWVGNLSDVSGVNDGQMQVNTYYLSQNYPNPFNPATKITYTLEKPGMVTLKVYNILGSLVSTLVNEQQNSGLHSVNFNGEGLSSGVYFYQINSGSYSSIKKMMLVK